MAYTPTVWANGDVITADKLNKLENGVANEQVGPAGPAGSAATVTVGTVTTGNAGTEASVTNSGTESAAVLNFVIPKGADGKDGAPKNYEYSGADLSAVFDSAAALHTAVAAGDFSRIRIGDYWPITVSGNYTDFARYTVPSGTTYYSDAELTTSAGTTAVAVQGEYYSATAVKFTSGGVNCYAAIASCIVGYTKTMNELVKMEVAAINPYLRHGDTELTAPHILFCSRDALANTVQMRCGNGVWLDTAATNPWLGSHAYRTLNDPDNGIIKLVEASTLGAYVLNGPNNKGMRALLSTMAAGAASPTSWEWADRGRLFLPTEREVYGAPVWQPASYEAGNLYNQWPIFAGSARHLIKGAGNGGTRCYWWLESPTSATTFAFVNYNGGADRYSAANTSFRLLLCFLFT